MIPKKSSYYRVLMLCIGLALTMGSLIWLQASVSPASAQAPEDSVVKLYVEVTENGLAPLAVDPPPVFFVGDLFTISIVALGVPDPGIFGSQFEVAYETTYLQAVTGSLVPGDKLQPVVEAVKTIDNAAGRASWAASRQGNEPDVPGDVVLASLTMEAVGATEPPEGETTTINLENVKLGRKGGFEVDVAGLVPLKVIIREDDGTPGDGDMVGNVKVEGRATDNQADNMVEAVGAANGPFNELTDFLGDFFFNNIPADTYTLIADRPGFLEATCEDVIHTEDALTTLADVILLAGNIVDNPDPVTEPEPVIDVADAVAIGAVFGSTDPQIADLNADGVVDVLDLILMSANFGEKPSANPWNCQQP